MAENIEVLRKGVPPRTIVIKLGSSSIVHETTHRTLLPIISSIVETVTELQRLGHKVVLVSSGAIAVGLKRMDMEKRPNTLAGKQALAAIGQGRLIALWDNLFGQLETPIAQVLLTRGDISDRTRYTNAVNTFKKLLEMGVVPIVNENDTVSVSEIKFGDNDTLSAITASMIQADYLFLLTDVDGLYTSNPRKDPDAKQIEVVDSVADIRGQVSTTTLGSSLGTGGMETKLIAAEISTAAGVTTVITSSKHPQSIFEIIEYDLYVTRKIAAPSLPQLPRPPHTIFTASSEPVRDLKSWTAHTLNPSGSVIITAGAYHILSKKDSGGKLLAGGVIGVIGDFASGQAVRIVVLKKGIHEENEQQLEEEKRAYLNSSGNRTPNGYTTPFDKEDVPESELAKHHTHDFHGFHRNGKVEEITDENVIEVGRGLSNYNSAQIMAVKGLNSVFLPHVLGYADTEHVVENVTIRIPA
ncbi:glutamate 5-kinase [Agrocybe pediades]|nr:glutamate 5-kinase [Agrocybe pediades]